MNAVNLVYQGWGVRKVSRYMGVSPGAVSKWVKKDLSYGLRPIPTESSRPHHHPNELSQNIIDKIVEIRLKHNRCAEVVHQELLNQGLSVSLSSVKRTLDRQGLIRKRSPWKRWHFEIERPLALKPGDLVQIDTIHLIPGKLYIYTLIDVFSRWAQAKVSERINTHRSLSFVCNSEGEFPSSFSMIQSDHGSEFSTYFTENVKTRLGSNHRHSRVRKPSDNGHLERFNRTLQEECLKDIPKTLRAYRKAIPEYIHYYNNERLHLGLNLKTPIECFQAID
jgi:transposase InsO family protein